MKPASRRKLTINKSYSADIFTQFDELELTYVYPTVSLSADMQVLVKTMFKLPDPSLIVGRMFSCDDDKPCGYLVRSSSFVVNSYTGLMVFNPGWASSSSALSVSTEAVQTVGREDDILAIYVPGKVALVTGTAVSEKLHSFLTMI